MKKNQNSTHSTRLARRLQASSDLTYTQALAKVRAAAAAGRLPYPLDKAGMDRALVVLLADPPAGPMSPGPQFRPVKQLAEVGDLLLQAADWRIVHGGADGRTAAVHLRVGADLHDERLLGVSWWHVAEIDDTDPNWPYVDVAWGDVGDAGFLLVEFDAGDHATAVYFGVAENPELMEAFRSCEGRVVLSVVGSVPVVEPYTSDLGRAVGHVDMAKVEDLLVDAAPRASAAAFRRSRPAVIEVPEARLSKQSPSRTPAMRPKTPKPGQSLVVRVDLDWFDPGCYAEVLVGPSDTLYDLARAIEVAFRRDGAHCAEFTFFESRRWPSVNDPDLPKFTTYGIEPHSGTVIGRSRHPEGAVVRVSDVAAVGETFGYVFDLDDEWKHTCRVLRAWDGDTPEAVTVLTAPAAPPPQYDEDADAA